jgi:hypothetical protein
MSEQLAKPRYLTKSRFKLAVECPTKLFFIGKPEYRNILQEDSFLEMLAEGGFQVGELAKLMYPTGYEIKSKNHEEAERETAELLKQENVILFEPAFRFEKLFVRVDILIKAGNSIQLIEVKAKSYNSLDPKIEKKRGGILAEMLPYVQDIAFQTYVFKNLYSSLSVASYLMMPDKAIASSIDGLNQYFKINKVGKQTEIIVDPTALEKGLGETLLAKVNVDHLIEYIYANGIQFPGGSLSLPEAAKIWADAYSRDQMILPVIGAHCGKCEFRANNEDDLKSGFHECWKLMNNWQDEDFSEGTVLDIWNYRGKGDAILRGARKPSQITETDIPLKTGDDGLSFSERQWMQIKGIPLEHDKGGYYLDSDLMSAEMQTWNYPYHLIDFETAAVALPFFKGMRPYEQIAFQFSHHILEESGVVNHVDEFLLAESGQFPNYEFARALKKSLEMDNGSVFMWSHHENTILEKIIEQLENNEDAPPDKVDLITFLKTLVKGGERAMIDLKILAQKAYYHPDTKASSSIKKVLPATMKTSEFLRVKYSQPIYGSPTGIKSSNFRDFIWWNLCKMKKLIDPYEILKESASDLLGNETNEYLEAEEYGIAEGGAAATAFCRLQFECLDIQVREKIKAALLRYCELDTLAMVMILEAWQDIVFSSR